jgi:hypothetical protein
MKTPLAATFPSFRDSIRNAADIDATIDFKASFDSLEIMEGVTRHFFLRALIDESMGSQTDWNAVDSLMLKALAAASKVARYRHAQLSAIKLAGDINAKVTDGASLDDLLVKIKGSWRSSTDPRADYRIGGCGRAAGLRTRQHIRSRRLVWKPQRPLDGTRA